MTPSSEASPNGICGFHIIAGAFTPSARLNGSMCSATCACTICVLVVSTAVVSETLKAAPMLRSRFMIAEASVRISAGIVENAIRFIGTKMKPMPKP